MQIYMTVNRLSGKFYIGKNKNCDEHYLGSGKYIKSAINKHGRENFYKIILETVESVELLNEREKHWIAYYRKLRAHLMYNISNGGEWGDVFTHHPDKDMIREKISDAGKTRFQNEEQLDSHRKRLKLCMSNPEVRKKMSDSIKLKFENAEYLEEHGKRSKISLSNPEVRKKMSDSAKAKFENAEYLEEHRKRTKLAMSNPEVRKKLSDASKLKFQNFEILEKHRKALSTTEARKKMSDSAKSYAFKSCSVDGTTYKVVWDAVHALGIKNREIRRRCKSVDYPTYFYTS